MTYNFYDNIFIHNISYVTFLSLFLSPSIYSLEVQKNFVIQINIRGYRSDNQTWTVQRIYVATLDTQDEGKQNKDLINETSDVHVLYCIFGDL